MTDSESHNSGGGEGEASLSGSEFDVESDTEWEACPTKTTVDNNNSSTAMTNNQGSNNSKSYQRLDSSFTSFSVGPEEGELLWKDSKADGCEKTNIFKWALHVLRYDDVNDLLSCFFFGKRVEDLLEWEQVELKRLFDYLETHFDLKVRLGCWACAR